MKRMAVLIGVVVALGIAGCSNSSGGDSTQGNLREAETKALEKQEGVSHAEAEREAGEATELAEKVQRSGIKVNPSTPPPSAAAQESPACKSDHEMLRAERAPGGTPAYAVEAEEMVREDCAQ